MRPRGADQSPRAAAADRCSSAAEPRRASCSTCTRTMNMQTPVSPYVGSGFSRTFLLIAALVLYAPVASAADITWTVDGVERAAILYAPKSPPSGKLPLIFSFHGHG